MLEEEDIFSDEGFEDQLEHEQEHEQKRETPPSEIDEEEQQALREKKSVETRTNRLTQLQKLKKSSNVQSDAERALKAQILLLCSALGGVESTSKTGEYVLGSDALSCLKDIKRWIKTVDDATNNWDVASACHDNGLVQGDLIPILIQLPKRINERNKNTYNHIMLSSLELLVALTRPLMLDVEKASENKIELYTKLKKAHVVYKNAILNTNKGKCLKSVVSLALPILSISKDQRTPRDTVILTLCLTFFRNVIRIEPANFTVAKNKTIKPQIVNSNMPIGIALEDVSYDVLFNSFKKNKVLAFIQTISAGISKEFDGDMLSTVCIDIYFYLTFKINPEDLFAPQVTDQYQPSSSRTRTQQKSSSSQPEKEVSTTTSQLSALFNQEKQIKKNLYNFSSTRHSNFGTLLSIRQGDEQGVTLSGQKQIMASDVLDELDSSRSKKPGRETRHNYKNDSTKSDFDTNLTDNENKKILNTTGESLKTFVSDFVEAGFTTLMSTLRRETMDDKADSFLKFHFFYVMAWVLKFERLFRGSSKDPRSFKRLGFLNATLSDEIISSLIKTSIPQYLSQNEFGLLKICVNTLKEILITCIETKQIEISKIPNITPDEEEELESYDTAAEGLLRTIFEREEDVDVLLKVPQNTQKVSLSYSHDILEFCQVMLKSFKFLTSLADPVIMAKRHRRHAKKHYTADNDFSDEEDEDSPLSEREIKRYQQIYKVRYASFEGALLDERVVNSFVWYFGKFSELNDRQVRRCLSYFNKLLIKKEEHFLKLLRLDFMLTLHDIKKSHFGSHTTKDFGKLLNYFMHTLEKYHERSPSVLLELLNVNQEIDRDVRMYLQTGEEPSFHESTPVRKKVVFQNQSLSTSHKINLLVSSLIYSDNTFMIEELIQEFERIGVKLAEAESNGGIDVNFKTQLLVLNVNLQRKAGRNPIFNALLVDALGLEHYQFSQETKSDEVNSKTAELQAALNSPLQPEEVEGSFTTSDILKSGEDYGEDYRDYNDNNDVRDSSNIDGNGYEIDDLGSSDSEIRLPEPDTLDTLDLMEARLEPNEQRVKGRALRRKRRVETDSEADDPLEPGPNSKMSKKKKSKKRRRDKDSEKKSRKKKTKPTHEKKTHLSSKFVQDDDDNSDNEEDRMFFERENRLHEMLVKNGNQPLTPEQYAYVFGTGSNDNEGVVRRDDFISVDDAEALTPTSNPVTEERISKSDLEDDESDEDIQDNSRIKPVSEDRISKSDLDDHDESQDSDSSESHTDEAPGQHSTQEVDSSSGSDEDDDSKIVKRPTRTIVSDEEEDSDDEELHHSGSRRILGLDMDDEDDELDNGLDAIEDEKTSGR